jgi:anthranilate phosphoribosyltransferase
MNELVQQLQGGEELNTHQVRRMADLLLDQKIMEDQKVMLLEALSSKGATPFEIASFVEAFLVHAVDPQIGSLDLPGPTLDVCGTGGDKLELFNISTTAMFVVAAAGAVVVKHGNRGITSKSGGADVLEALGVKIDMHADQFRSCVEQTGVGFLFAPIYHPAFKAVAGVRKKLAERGVRTIFNIIGPLLNPVRPQCQLVGVYDPELGPVFAEILQRLGRDSAWVVHGTTADGRSVDEVSLMGSTYIYQSGRSRPMTNEVLAPQDLGFAHADVADLQGGNAMQNAEILTAILAGQEIGPKRDMVLMNAAAALACAGLVDDLAKGIEVAREMIANGAAMEKLRRLQQVSASVG